MSVKKATVPEESLYKCDPARKSTTNKSYTKQSEINQVSDNGNVIMLDNGQKVLVSQREANDSHSDNNLPRSGRRFVAPRNDYTDTTKKARKVLIFINLLHTISSVLNNGLSLTIRDAVI